MKIKPRIRNTHKHVDFADLKDGDTYLGAGELYVKIGTSRQMGFCLSDNNHHEDMCGCLVIPVDSEITWSHKKPARVKK